MKRQPSYKGGRMPVHSAFIPALERAIAREMARFNVSRSFVIATACAHALGIDEQPEYKPQSKASGKKVPVDFLRRVK